MKKLLFAILLLLIAANCGAADKTIHELTALGAKPATVDEVMVWDTSTSTTKRLTIAYLTNILDVDSYGGLEDAITDIGATEISVLITTTQTLAANCVVPATLELIFLRGGYIDLSGKTLTVNHIMAGPHQIFSTTPTYGTLIAIHDAWDDGAGDAILPSAHEAMDLGSGASRYNTLWAADLNVSDVSVSGRIAMAAMAGNPLSGLMSRSRFDWKDANEIYIYPGAYYSCGATDRFAYWDAKLTYTFTSLAVDDWSYLYIDDSDLETAGADIVVVGYFIDSLTEPVYSEAKHGWYNGNDRCIMAVLGDAAGDILEFFHDGGDYVCFADLISDRGMAQLTTAWVDSTLTMPSFATRINAMLASAYSNALSKIRWRTNSQTGTIGHNGPEVAIGATENQDTQDLIADSSQKIEIREQSASTNTYGIFTNGWYFPVGM